MSSWLSTSEISVIFSDEIGSARGKVTSVIDSNGGVFARSILRCAIEVGPGDRLKGGVAMCATENDVFVHPYVYRMVCSNGAIMAKATQTRHISRENWFLDPECEGDVETGIRSAIRACCAREAFETAAGQMRSAQEMAADMAINFAGYFTGSRRSVPKSFWDEIMRRYEEASDRSAYGLMNAVTSVARDTGDPKLKWRLEELGGGIPAMLGRPATRPSGKRALELV